MFAGKKSAQIREILISESAWEEMTCLFAPSLVVAGLNLALSQLPIGNKEGWSLDEKQTVGGRDAAIEAT